MNHSLLDHRFSIDVARPTNLNLTYLRGTRSAYLFNSLFTKKYLEKLRLMDANQLPLFIAYALMIADR